MTMKKYQDIFLIFFSGESGAGKTETCKLMIKQLIDLSGGASEVDQQILLVCQIYFLD